MFLTIRKQSIPSTPNLCHNFIAQSKYVNFQGLNNSIYRVQCIKEDKNNLNSQQPGSQKVEKAMKGEAVQSKFSMRDIPKEYQRIARRSARKAKFKAVAQKSQSISVVQELTAEELQDQPKVCSQAINLGLQQFEKGNYQQAIEYFTVALELPGNGAYRFANSIREYSCPSEGEEQAALYNLTCSYAKLKQIDSALICLEALLEAGYDDFEQIRSDPDLYILKGKQQFNEIIGKFDTPQNFVGKLFGGKKKDEDTNQPWLQW
eukprot:TRINITY_DN2725_c2_g1_i4.p2 TRINITY_DN2725_c2_g1~~TRINITY_DN2725_c2_g1_i4.p2  ORF type:complete len:278 (+),score=24.36 TRINITY_DN2725_c2_g1_i4:50-835(+)